MLQDSHFSFRNRPNINIPSNVQRIGFGSFSHCYNVTSINIDNGLREISSYAFTGLFKVRNLIIPESVTRIGKNALHMLNLDYFYVLNPNCIIERQGRLTMRNTNVQRVYKTYDNTAAGASLDTLVEQFIIQPLYSTNNTQAQQQMYMQPQQIYNAADEPMQTQQHITPMSDVNANQMQEFYNM